MSQAKIKKSPVAALSDYLKDSKTELKKVSFPTRQETIQATLAAVSIVLVVAVFLGLADLLFNKVMESILLPRSF